MNLGGALDLDGLIDVLAGADAVIVGNTGPAHLAAAVNTPVVSIFAPTVPATRWHPWRVRYELLGNQKIPCAGCRATVCPLAGHPCVGRLKLRTVLEAVERVAPANSLAAAS
jgi:ADP-heptose:LPS heptosyltransferase